MQHSISQSIICSKPVWKINKTQDESKSKWDYCIHTFVRYTFFSFVFDAAESACCYLMVSDSPIIGGLFTVASVILPRPLIYNKGIIIKSEMCLEYLGTCSCGEPLFSE